MGLIQNLSGKLFDKDDTDDHPLGKWKTEVIKLQETDRFYSVEIPSGEEELQKAIVFAAFTPRLDHSMGLEEIPCSTHLR